MLRDGENCSRLWWGDSIITDRSSNISIFSPLTSSNLKQQFHHPLQAPQFRMPPTANYDCAIKVICENHATKAFNLNHNHFLLLLLRFSANRFYFFSRKHFAAMLRCAFFMYIYDSSRQRRSESSSHCFEATAVAQK